MADGIDDKTLAELIGIVDYLLGGSTARQWLNGIELGPLRAALRELQSLRSSPLPEEVEKEIAYLIKIADGRDNPIPSDAQKRWIVIADLIERLGRRVAELEKERDELKQHLDDTVWRHAENAEGDL